MNAKDKKCKEAEELEYFTCSLCEMTAPYRYYGKRPQGVRRLKFKEEVYTMDDPFSEAREILVLGSHCSICNACVCMDDRCSLFHEKRYCTTCLQKSNGEIPSIQMTTSAS